MYIEDIEEACRKVINGDQEALKQLGLDNASYPVPSPQSTSSTSLQATYNGALRSVVAARELGLTFVEKQCELTLQYIQAIAAAKKKMTLQHEVDAEDVAEVMLALIDEEKDKYSRRKATSEPSESEEEEHEETPESEERKAEEKEERQQRHQAKKRKADISIEETEEKGRKYRKVQEEKTETELEEKEQKHGQS